jgi:hypothetical protein
MKIVYRELLAFQYSKLAMISAQNLLQCPVPDNFSLKLILSSSKMGNCSSLPLGDPSLVELTDFHNVDAVIRDN